MYETSALTTHAIFLRVPFVTAITKILWWRVRSQCHKNKNKSQKATKPQTHKSTQHMHTRSSYCCFFFSFLCIACEKRRSLVSEWVRWWRKRRRRQQWLCLVYLLYDCVCVREVATFGRYWMGGWERREDQVEVLLNGKVKKNLVLKCMSCHMNIQSVNKVYWQKYLNLI